MNYRTKAMFYRQLGAMLTSGLDLVRALKQFTTGAYTQLRPPAQALYNAIVAGVPLAEAMQSLSSRTFSPLEISVVHAGEQSGNLAESVTRLATYFEFLERTRSRLLGGMVYPIVLFHAAIIIPAVPALVLQGPGRFLSLVIPPFLVVYGCLFGFLAVRRTIGASSPLTAAWDEMVVRIPVFGKLARTTALVRFIQSFTCLLSAGVGAAEAVRIAAGTLGNAAMEREMLQAVPRLQKGTSLVESFAGNRFITPVLADMLATGEESGRLEESLERVAGYLQQEADATVERIVTILPVLVYLAVAAYIGYIVISFYGSYINQVNSLMNE